MIDVSYLDTTVWEIGGRYLSTDHPSGRVIKFPNTKVFSTPVFNYSWPLFPYVWNEIKFNVAYESDLEFVGSTMQKIAEEELGEAMMEKVALFRDLLARTPVDHLEVRERPSVQFRVSDNTWLEAIVRYLVEPKEAGRVRSRLTQKILAALNAAPDRVLFSQEQQPLERPGPAYRSSHPTVMKRDRAGPEAVRFAFACFEIGGAPRCFRFFPAHVLVCRIRALIRGLFRFGAAAGRLRREGDGRRQNHRGHQKHTQHELVHPDSSFDSDTCFDIRQAPAFHQ